MKIIPAKVYAVFDTEKQEYYQTYRGKRFWAAKGHAKNAWMNNPPSEKEFPEGYNDNCFKGWERRCMFDEQTRYVIHEFGLTPSAAREVK